MTGTYQNRHIWRKQYVDAIVLHKRDGSIEIMEILWPDGRRFKVDKTEAHGYASGSRTGSGGKEYAIWIKGRQRLLFLEKNRFFVETDWVNPQHEKYGMDLTTEELQSPPFGPLK